MRYRCGQGHEVTPEQFEAGVCPACQAPKVPTIEDVAKVYVARRDRIAELEKEIKAFEERQLLAEQFILAHNPGVELIAEIYIARRNEASDCEKQAKEIKERQSAFESWFLARMKETGSDKGFKTSVGTIYPLRAESVTVAEWDTFVEQNLLRPAAAKVCALLHPIKPVQEADVEAMIQLLKFEMPFELVNKAVNKTAALELMGDFDEKTKGRPNPPPAGINYSAVQKVGVRKS